MKYELFLGNCEQFRYEINKPTFREVMKRVRDITFCRFPVPLYPYVNPRVRKLPARTGYPSGAVHYKFDGRKGSILLIRWKKDEMIA